MILRVLRYQSFAGEGNAYVVQFQIFLSWVRAPKPDSRNYIYMGHDHGVIFCGKICNYCFLQFGDMDLAHGPNAIIFSKVT